MKKLGTLLTGLMVVAISSSSLIAQTAGDYRSRASGNWSVAQNWERFNGSAWVPSGTAPSGAETITVQGTDSIFVDVGASITGTLVVTGEGEVEGNDSLTVADGGTYQHDRDGGSIPLSTWATGSTLLLTGTIAVAPEDRNQNYYNVTFNTPGLLSNLNMALDSTTISGDVRVLSTGSARWYLTSAADFDSSTVTILGDVFVEDGAFATQGTSRLTTFKVHHFGNIVVTGGSFAIGRGSQASGTGTTTWFLHEGDFSISNAEARNSNPTPGNAKFVFAKGDTQRLTFDNVEYAGGDIHFEVSDTAILDITQDFRANGLFTNRGEIIAPDSLIFTDGSIYDHARNGGAVPQSYWEVGSTAMFTGITTSAPDNRGQDYYNLVLDTPGLSSNRDMALQDRTISGDLTLKNSGSSRWRLLGGSSGTITIMGDVIVEDGSLETQGTSSATEVVVEHHGNVVVTGGTFAVSRGSQASGTGSTRWYMRQGDFSISDATTRNSNSTNAWFVFANQGGTQNLTLTNVSYGGGGLPIVIDSAATVDMGTSEIGGSGQFTLNAGAAVATAHAGGIASAVQTSGTITLDGGASYTFNGTEAQVTSTTMPMTVNNLTIDNAAGVQLSQTTTINGVLRLIAGVFDNSAGFTLGAGGTISLEGGSLLIPTSVETLEGLPSEFALSQNYPNPFNPATTIQFDVPVGGDVQLGIYNSLGQLVRTLVSGEHAPGKYSVSWNGADDSGRRVASGLYYYRLNAGEFTSVRKLVLTK